MWSIIMEPGKTYSTVVENTFHLSMATLDVASVKKADDIHTVYVETNDGPRVILCHLSKSSKMFQCSLDHVITKGTDIKFVTSATANIHMTGYVDDLEEDDEDQMYSDLESEAEEEEEESQILKKQTADKGNKRKAENSFSKKSKSIKLDDKKSANSDDDEDESDDTLDFEDDSDENGLTVSDLLDDEAESGDEDDDDDDDDDDDEDEDEEDDESEGEEDESDVDVKPQSTKKTKQQLNGKEQSTPKKEQKTPNKGQEKTPKVQEKTPKGQKTPIPKTPDANKSLINGTTESNKKKNKEPKTPLNESKTKPDTPLPKNKLNQQQKLNGGVMITDLKVGDGAVAKPGKNVKVYYVGRLKSTGKVFDSMQKGPGFTFGLQRGEVIKGWDIGIAGMKVGGKRKVICPPNMAYGAKGSPPEIPPNSTLVFDVELKHVN